MNFEGHFLNEFFLSFRMPVMVITRQPVHNLMRFSVIINVSKENSGRMMENVFADLKNQERNHKIQTQSKDKALYLHHLPLQKSWRTK
ncbi:hypothetical protein Sjap_011730 [Stephania japonica]|uniref:Uncharacterized protein n=1 Tax=Stephania japonica TaxID=461633 RepID=A0AAP0P596_9MAGN